MNDARQSGHENDIAAVVQSVLTVAPDARDVGSETRLVGSDAILDSVGFVTLLVALEQRLGDGIDLSTAFLSYDAVDEQHNPFRTVGSLAAYIGQLRSPGA